MHTSRSGASTSRQTNVPRTPLSSLRIAANETTNINSIGMSSFDKDSGSVSNKRKYPAGVTSSTHDLTFDAGGSKVRPDTPMSEAINPTSIHVTKRVSQPTHVLESIPSFALNFDGDSTAEPVNIEASTSRNEQTDFFHYDKYDLAETEDPTTKKKDWTEH
ncbi:hypothetical protein TSUD_165090 [Trifolium subterraneum]|uniref:Uncharacterized protein n=1 Tax=Trifolium subterraneum TaxID=3900 RepID=A0A2Z6N120_TRISU|nr:hypothetical protein TSUD_165090 [Trifolium subterraneum]